MFGFSFKVLAATFCILGISWLALDYFVPNGIARTAATDQRGSGGCRRQLLRGAITQARAANRATFESQTYAIGAFAPACARASGNSTPLTPLLQSNFAIH
jgi:hypothetical protein